MPNQEIFTAVIPLLSLMLAKIRMKKREVSETWFIAILLSSSIPSCPEYGTCFLSVSVLRQMTIVLFIGQVTTMTKPYNLLFPTELTRD